VRAFSIQLEEIYGLLVIFLISVVSILR